MEELLKSLIDIQQRLDAPKNQVNNFGHYSYRSLEDIEAAIKPLLREHNCGIRFSDQVVEHCGRTFLLTTLFFFNTKGESISVTAEAEHAIEQKGMDKSQISGCASSYARKYAMNALFCIDDTKDADTNQFHDQTSFQTPQQQQQNNIPSASRTRAPRKAMTPSIRTVPQPQPAPVYDRYSGIKRALSNCNSTQELLDLYNQHLNEIQGNPDILNLFSIRRQELQAA